MVMYLIGAGQELLLGDAVIVGRTNGRVCAWWWSRGGVRAENIHGVSGVSRVSMVVSGSSVIRVMCWRYVMMS